jgi:hypothetical protein
MTVTYKDHEIGSLILKMPVLHRVKYADTADRAQAVYQYSYKDHLVNEWLAANCRHPYYRSPGYLYEKFIEFECDEEAVMFALRWS